MPSTHRLKQLNRKAAVFILFFLFTGCTVRQPAVSEETAVPSQSAESVVSPAVSENTAEPAVYSPVQEDTLVPYKVEEYPFSNDEKYIFGHAFIPQNGSETYPTVILCHGIGSDHSNTDNFSAMFAERGIAAYSFDFCGGSTDSGSSGEFLDMSVATEAEDLNDVIDYVKTLPFTDPNHLYLLGQSQGGYVTTKIAAVRSDEFRGMILMFPAFNINDLILEMFPDQNNIPMTGIIFDQTVGRCYFADALAEDIKGDMERCSLPVLILHGDADPVVPLSYSEEAVTHFPNAELVVIEHTEHGFFGADAETALSECMAFFLRTMN